LTIADSQAHQLITAILAPSQLPLISEEGIHPPYAERKHWKSYWLVDPLDGTKEFIKRNDEFTVNIALMADNQPVAGIIYAPVSKEIHVGIVGKGAWKMSHLQPPYQLNQLIHQGKRLPIDNKVHAYTVTVSRSYINQATQVYIESMKEHHPDLEIIRRGSSLKYCLIAEGAADCYPRFGPTMEWDSAAGHALVKAVGKNIFRMDQQTEIIYNKENLTNPSFIVL
jgi:3'(2'), 5'-bisphosphate nucleotidase